MPMTEMPEDLAEALQEFEDYARCAEATGDPRAEAGRDEQLAKLQKLILQYINEQE